MPPSSAMTGPTMAEIEDYLWAIHSPSASDKPPTSRVPLSSAEKNAVLQARREVRTREPFSSSKSLEEVQPLTELLDKVQASFSQQPSALRSIDDYALFSELARVPRINVEAAVRLSTFVLRHANGAWPATPTSGTHSLQQKLVVAAFYDALDLFVYTFVPLFEKAPSLVQTLIKPTMLVPIARYFVKLGLQDRGNLMNDPDGFTTIDKRSKLHLAFYAILGHQSVGGDSIEEIVRPLFAPSPSSPDLSTPDFLGRLFVHTGYDKGDVRLFAAKQRKDGRLHPTDATFAGQLFLDRVSSTLSRWNVPKNHPSAHLAAFAKGASVHYDLILPEPMRTFVGRGNYGDPDLNELIVWFKVNQAIIFYTQTAPIRRFLPNLLNLAASLVRNQKFLNAVPGPVPRYASQLVENLLNHYVPGTTAASLRPGPELFEACRAFQVLVEVDAQAPIEALLDMRSRVWVWRGLARATPHLVTKFSGKPTSNDIFHETQQNNSILWRRLMDEIALNPVLVDYARQNLPTIDRLLRRELDRLAEVNSQMWPQLRRDTVLQLWDATIDYLASKGVTINLSMTCAWSKSKTGTAVWSSVDEPRAGEEIEDIVLKPRPDELKRCKKCKVRYYCSRDHQVQDWPVHRLACTTPNT